MIIICFGQQPFVVKEWGQEDAFNSSEKQPKTSLSSSEHWKCQLFQRCDEQCYVQCIRITKGFLFSFWFRLWWAISPASTVLILQIDKMLSNQRMLHDFKCLLLAQTKKNKQIQYFWHIWFHSISFGFFHCLVRTREWSLFAQVLCFALKENERAKQIVLCLSRRKEEQRVVKRHSYVRRSPFLSAHSVFGAVLFLFLCEVVHCQ